MEKLIEMKHDKYMLIIKHFFFIIYCMSFQQYCIINMGYTIQYVAIMTKIQKKTLKIIKLL